MTIIKFGLLASAALSPSCFNTCLSMESILFSVALNEQRGEEGKKQGVSPDHRLKQALLTQDGDGAGIRPEENPKNSGKGFGASYD